MTDIPQKATKLSDEEAALAILAAYRSTFEGDPKAIALSILCAQSALETGHWQHMYNWNFGNIRGSYQGMTQSLKGADEIVDGKRVVVESGFRAYPTCHDGAVDFIRFLGVDTTPNNGRPNRYQKAWDAAMSGDVTAYVRELKAAGYFTASESAYLKGVKQLADQLLPICAAVLVPDTDELISALDRAEDAIELAKARLRDG